MKSPSRTGATLWCAALACAGFAAPSWGGNGPFDAPSPLPYHLPPFNEIHEADFRAALEAGMAQQRAEVAAITASADAPTFDNTLVALERSGQMLARVNATFGNLTASNTNPEHDAMDAEMAPRLAAQVDAIFLDAALFARVKALHERRAQLGLDPVSLRLLERYHRLFLRAGAALRDPDQRRLRAINMELAALGSRYDQALMKANSDAAVVVDARSELAGLSEERVSAAAEAARTRGLEGKWVIALDKPTGQAVLAYLENRALRERIYRAAAGRARHGAGDTTGIAVQTARLRAEKAAILGYPNWAAYALEDEGAGTPAAVNAILDRVGRAAVANARAQAASLQTLIDRDCADHKQRPFRLEAWDWAYYAERLRKQQFAFDEAMVRPYFELDHVLTEGLFFAAHALYGLGFRERRDLPVYQADVRVFEVLDAGDRPLGLLLLDYYARENKQGGAWDSEFVSQSGLLGLQTVAVNNLNLPKPAPGQPTLMSFDDVKGMFHEFGHALHGIFSRVQYPLLAGTAVPPDFVEYPSQFNEMWSYDAVVLAHMARHYQTGAPLPPDLLQKVLAARSFGQAYATAEYAQAAIIDQAWHQVPAAAIPGIAGIAAFEDAALHRAGMAFHPVPPRYRSAYFPHVFGGATGGYSAGYYAYLWSDVLAKDTELWMKLHGGLQRANGDFLRAKVLSRGFSVDLPTLFREFYGSDPDVGPLLDARGLARTSSKKNPG
jgi:peptidyl-dipeptidase Dcp